MVKRVLLVDDHAIFTQAMKLVIGITGSMEIVGTASTLAEGRELIFTNGTRDVDLVVVDLILPDGNGAVLVSEIKSRKPELPVVVLSAENDFSRALEAGADATINKSKPLPQIVAVLQRIAA